jgi:DNA-binding NarL/FixJ family response regulator
MATDKIKQLAEYQQKVEKLKKAVADQLKQALSSLHKKYGFETPHDLIKAIKNSIGGKRAARGAKPAGGKKRKRAKITPEMKQKLKSQVEAGKTGTEIAKSLGISLPSVQNIKKELGLVKARKK